MSERLAAVQHGISLDTVLTNGSTLRQVVAQAKRELHDARTAMRYSGPGVRDRKSRQDHAVGRVQGYYTICTLLGIDLSEFEEE